MTRENLRRVQERLRSYPAAPTMAEIQRSGQRYPTGENTGNTGNYPSEPPRGRVDYPSTRYQSYRIFGGGVQVSVPNNWRQVSEGNSVWFVPEGGYGQFNGQPVFTHGVNFGVAQTQQSKSSTVYAGVHQRPCAGKPQSPNERWFSTHVAVWTDRLWHPF